jgi:oligopeptide/dipeptide ABC transporter ATP-binding protein
MGEESTETIADGGPIMDVRNLTVTFATSLGLIRRSKLVAVDNVSLQVRKGESLGIVGESGSGKTTLARALVKLVRPAAGSVTFDGNDIFRQKGAANKDYRRRVQIIFQDPYESLNPRSTARQAVEEPIIIHGLISDEEERRKRVEELLFLAGLNAATVETKYPHELSGGERQRVSLARALALNPELLIADEPVSMLDVSIRIGVINLMLDFKRMFNLTYIFITHDLAVARYFCNRIAVMYRGKIVEVAQTEPLLTRPLHPYTKLLIDSVPGHTATEAEEQASVSPGADSREIIGCRFNPRCAYAQDVCRHDEPDLLEVEPGHFVACHFPLK